jgi:predicted DNA-binding protein with PD1-like motif
MNVRWLAPTETGPRGEAPSVKRRALGPAAADGSRRYVLVLAPGDDIPTAIADFARAEKVMSAHFVAIGAVREAEVGWYDPARKAYKAMTRAEPMEVLTLSGDVAVDGDGRPIVHAHAAFSRSDGRAWGGHVIHAVVSPTLELFVTTFPDPLKKQVDPVTGLKLISP